MKTVIVTAEPHANYHLSYFDSKHARGLVHLVPSVNDVQGESLVPVTDKLDVLDNAKLLVITGGVVTEWTHMIGYMANERDIPVVFSELAYTQETPEHPHVPDFKAVSAVSPYGAFNLHGYAEHLDHIEITGHPMLDDLPEWNPEERRLLVLSSEFKSDAGASLKASIRILESEGWNVVVRLHPRESKDSWDGFTLSKTRSLIEDLVSSEAVIGVPGTAFATAAAMHIPTAAIEGSTLDTVLPEYKYLFPYLKPSEVAKDIKLVAPLIPAATDFITGPVGGSADRLIDFWKANEAELHFGSNLNLSDLF